MRPDSRLLKIPKGRTEGAGRAASLEAAWLWRKNDPRRGEHLLFRSMIYEKDIRVFGGG